MNYDIFPPTTLRRLFGRRVHFNNDQQAGGGGGGSAGGGSADKADEGDQQQDQQQAADQAGKGGQQQKPDDDIIEVDLFGASVRMPRSEAQKIIEKRDGRTQEFRQMQQKLEETARKAEENDRRARAAEQARQGDLEAAERTFSERYATRIDKMSRAVIRASIEAQLRANPDFIGDEASLRDAQTLLAANELQIDEETLTVKAGDKTVADLVKDFLNDRPAFRKARGRTPPASPRQSGEQQAPARPASPQSMIASGLAKTGLQGKELNR